MNNRDEVLVRYVVKKMRKAHGLRQEDIAGISTATVSNIENGKIPVTDDTFIHFLKQINLYPVEKLHQEVKKEREKMEDLNLTLKSIEAIMEKGNEEIAMEQLKNIEIENFHPLALSIRYLEGRYYRLKDDLKKANDIFINVIRLAEKNNIDPPTNVLAYCYKELGNNSFLKNDLTNALHYVNKGLEVFDENKGRKEVKQRLQSNKIQYLLKMGQSDHAAQILNDLWQHLSEIENIRVVLNIYRFRAAILRGRGDYEEAIKVCQEGIEIAVRNDIKNRHLDLLNILGTVYLKQNRYEKARKCFQIVLWMDAGSNYPRRNIDSLSNLGTLFIQLADWKQADVHLDEAIRMGREVGDSYRLAKALIVRGNYFFYQGQYNKAVPFYEEAAELLRTHGFKQRLSTALLMLSHCFDKMDKNDDLVRCYKELLKIQGDIDLQSEEELYDF
ncbi:MULTISPECIES: tetratricopeptide repeat protein [Laceyella]|uniref:Tetratricopeptide repeat protein n=2 Tax=Laceyella TaxID=292635 RepID=A0ABY5U554_LACSH|nr:MULTISPECIES: tetratricopeptide repeat protein [Laceyella]PRZ16321.1 helix-turn-helix protein [Laceyella sediminis]UWE03407.1 tetratricopeptide repeat protein [Laceyella sacchari]